MANTQLTTPWDYRQSWNDGSYSYDGHTILWEHRTISVTDYIKQRYLSPLWYRGEMSNGTESYAKAETITG